MSDPFNRSAGLTFARTQPREWRDIPFEGERSSWAAIIRGIGVALAVVAVFSLSL